MIKEACISIKKDFSSAVFYWLSFVITSFCIFLFFQLIYLPEFNLQIGKDDTTLVTFTIVMMAAVCLIVVFFANDFYVRKKAKELAIFLISGSTYKKIMTFIMCQTCIIFILAIPLGIILGYLFLPICSYLMLYLLGISYTNIIFSMQGFIIACCIVGFEVFWCCLLNFGYCYRHTINDFLFESKNLKIEISLSFLKRKIPKIFYILLYVGPILGLFRCGKDTSGFLVMTVIGMVGVYNLINKIIIPYIKKQKKYKYITDSNKFIYKGLVQEDLTDMNKLIVLLIFGTLIFVSIIGIVYADPIQMMITILCYVVSIILTSLSVIFKFSNSFNYRQKIFNTIMKVGYLESDINYIKIKEIINLHSIIALIALPYEIISLCALYCYSYIKLILVFILIAIFCIILVLSGLLNYCFYRRN